MLVKQLEYLLALLCKFSSPTRKSVLIEAWSYKIPWYKYIFIVLNWLLSFCYWRNDTCECPDIFLHYLSIRIIYVKFINVGLTYTISYFCGEFTVSARWSRGIILALCVHAICRLFDILITNYFEVVNCKLNTKQPRPWQCQCQYVKYLVDLECNAHSLSPSALKFVLSCRLDNFI